MTHEFTYIHWLNTFNDPTFWIYILNAIVSFIGFIVFVWWWWQNRRASRLYAYMTLLFFSNSISYSINCIGRHLAISHIYEFQKFTSTFFWPLRGLLVLIVMTGIVFHVSSRIIGTLKRRKKFLERKNAVLDNEFTEEILIVDDHKPVIDVIEKGLKLVFPNITIYTAYDGNEALKIFEKNPNVNFILTDLYLPKLTGFDLCELVKTNCPWTIMVAMTGYPIKFELFEARKVGFDDYIQKPFPVSELIVIARREFQKLEQWKKIKTKNNP